MEDYILTNNEYLCNQDKHMDFKIVKGKSFTYVSPTTGGETSGIIASHFIPRYTMRKLKNGKLAHSIELHVVSDLGNSYDLTHVFFDDFTL